MILNHVDLLELAKQMKKDSQGDPEIDHLFRTYKIFYNRQKDSLSDRTEKEIKDLEENVGELFQEMAEVFVIKSITDERYVEPVISLLRNLHGLSESKSGLVLIDGGKKD